ncbi:exodeoxyribonuclease VII large subunit [Candidatus Liberibacter asiaticus]|uniref:Exodeoxyribonuclease 7 large subunit n=2 Tax=Liberibacter asiaticus TaxID=34021 RepID=C6XFW1_LIBAP|nr:exodeoxyribonuclease VII large subunit [Candidatus Liberibacter asiaticus]ACT57264.1 exodeoxyribonuclease VII large subunit [Candidatus Liberibacter asiaticus str. psy62]AGH16771.1 exodeoxyribonuclease VII large subunit [Candidatus Liberibacter asiaticus str. gxpsy]ALK07140.1 exodeoxyribonuclease VII large subunit [Candidatus Liberibacter asiaticus]ASK52616.1 exodeoxyribonuclease VII large subunit [Candidatus Liberibacter asiaticus]AWL13941.1 exodeoxyribonuclease VII large subunit [Candidat
MNPFSQKNSLDHPEYSVSELSYHLKHIVESNLSHVCVRGEISGYRGIHSSGHAYFSLKDNHSRIDAIIWKGTLNKIEFLPEEGIEFLVIGKITTFPGSSKYQIIIESLIPSGSGTLLTALEKRKKKLLEEGLFSDQHKNPIPFIPKIIAVITSPTGAVIRDILQRISCRFPLRVIIFPVKVQGDECPKEIANAILQLNTLKEGRTCPRPDIIILARGGGSIEDLWHFNDEMIVRAIANSSIPIISAIGHETDWTLADYAADLRAPTPTGAAEMAVPVKEHLQSSLINLEARLNNIIIRLIKYKINTLNSLLKALPNSDQTLSCSRYRLDRLPRELEHNLEIIIFRKYRHFNHIINRIKSDFLIHNIQKNRQHILEKQQHIEQIVKQHLRYIFLEKKEKIAILHMLREQTKNRIFYLHTHIKKLITRIEFILSHKIKSCHTSVSITTRILQSFAYKNTLKRGYTSIQDTNNNFITQKRNLATKTRILINFFDGQANAIVINKAPPKEQPTKKCQLHNNKREKQGTQGELF